MSEQPGWTPGQIVWQDLTVANADGVRDFYRQVVGWGASPQDMGGYEDYSMTTPDGQDVVAGICHARGVNAGLPPQWLVYIAVANLGMAIERCVALGGEVIDGPRQMGNVPYCTIRDPAGAVCALIQAEP